MKVITLTQPWATLVAIGAKKIETRSWATTYRGPLAIHAAKGLSSVGGAAGLMSLCRTEPFRSALLAAGILGTPALPLGAIVAVSELASCIEINGRPTGFAVHGNPESTLMWWLTVDEQAFGDYSPGRYALLLANVRALPEPIPARGALGLWEYEGQL